MLKIPICDLILKYTSQDLSPKCLDKESDLALSLRHNETLKYRWSGL